MLGDSPVMATLAVDDIEAAKKFYGETLGLRYDKDNEGGVVYDSGGAKCFIYVSEFAGTNQATAASWNVDDIESVVSDLKSKGVTFEHYDFEWAKLEGDIHVMGEGDHVGKAVWFKDPAGNILNISSGM